MMNGHGKSDSPVVPGKLANKAEEGAEAMEGRGLAKGNLNQRNTHRTQSREIMHSGLERVREAVKRDKSSLSTDPLSRLYPRQEPGALVAHAVICVGGAGQPAFLPRRKRPKDFVRLAKNVPQPCWGQEVCGERGRCCPV